jgi:hypothetical protein
MEETEFVTYQTFNDRALALDLANILKENKIQYEFDDTGNFDPAFSNNELNKDCRIKIRSQDFQKADSILMDIYSRQIDEAPADYYLFKFTDDELMDLIEKRDEWSKYDYLLALKILKQHGKEVTREKSEALKVNRYKELSKKKTAGTPILTLGYATAFFGGLAGIVIAYYLITAKKILPDGKVINVFDSSVRQHGKRILVIGTIALVLSFIYIVKILGE